MQTIDKQYEQNADEAARRSDREKAHAELGAWLKVQTPANLAFALQGLVTTNQDFSTLERVLNGAPQLRAKVFLAMTPAQRKAMPHWGMFMGSLEWLRDPADWQRLRLAWLDLDAERREYIYRTQPEVVKSEFPAPHPKINSERLVTAKGQALNKAT